jgi:hypothetical protein
MENYSISPPDTGDLQGNVLSPTKGADPQDKASRRSKNKQQRKDKGSKTEHDNVNEDSTTNKINNDTSIPNSEQNTPSGIEVGTIGTTSEDNSPQSSDSSNHVATSLATKFGAWNRDATPQEHIDFSYQETDTSILKTDDTISETTQDPPNLSEFVNRYKPCTGHGLKIQGRLQNTKNRLMSTASKWAGNMKTRSDIQGHNTSTVTFPDFGDTDITGSNPSPYGTTQSGYGISSLRTCTDRCQRNLFALRSVWYVKL